MYRCIFLIFAAWLLLTSGCKPFQSLNETQAEQNELERVIQEARVDINRVLRRQRIRPKNYTFVYQVYGQYKDESYYGKPLALEGVKNLDDFFSKIGIGFVSAFLLDEKDRFEIYVSRGYFIKNPSAMSFYKQKKDLIEVALNSSYIGFIRVFNCPDGFFYGIKKAQIDFYKYENEEFILVRSIR